MSYHFPSPFPSLKDHQQIDVHSIKITDSLRLTGKTMIKQS